MSPPAPDAQSHPAPPPLSWRLALACVALGAVGQLLFLARWPLYVVWIRLDPLPATVVALIRMGVYSGLFLGLLHRDGTAWAATVLELIRGFLLFAALVLLQHPALANPIYPAVWAQGLLAGLLPAAVALATGVSLGWRPGARILDGFAATLRAATAAFMLLALALNRVSGWLHVEDRDVGGAYLRRGLPIAAFLAAVELAGALLSR